MPSRPIVLAAALATAAALGGCHTVRYHTARPASVRRVEQKLHFYFWGLKGKPVIDLDAACPEGVARWRNDASAGDWVANFLTLGIRSPRTVVIECAEVSR